MTLLAIFTQYPCRTDGPTDNRQRI